MKTVGKQLQDARLAKNWTPELAARETKIKVDRLRDLEADDYSHFTSPTYARGFVRTYARSLGLDEYKILRQLDTKLPDDDSANIASESGVAYLPETALPPRAAHRDYTGLYIVMGLGAVVTLAIVVVLVEAYRVGELPTYFGVGKSALVTTANSTNDSGMAAAPAPDKVARALPVDSNTPPPVVETPVETPPSAPRALPVDVGTTPAPTPPAADPTMHAVRALPVDPSELTNAPSATGQTPDQAPPTPSPSDTAPDNPDVAGKTPPRALPVSASELAADAANSGTAPATSTVALNSIPATTPPASGPATTSSTSQQTNGSGVMEPSLPAVEPSSETSTNSAAVTAADPDKRLVLTATQDSFVQVTALDATPSSKPLYASVLRSGQSVGFDGRKFSINVAVPSAVDIRLDGVNYGPHSDGDKPETFNVESHLP
jgi:cytoskeleton protein RodZ